MIRETIINAVERAGLAAADIADEARFFGLLLRMPDRFEDKAVEALGIGAEYKLLAEVARLLNTDERLRDALAEARDRAAGVDAEDEADCGSFPPGPGIDFDSPCHLSPGHDGLHANFAGQRWPQTTDEPDLTPPDAQDDEAGEVSDER